MISSSWSGFSDNISGIQYFEYAIGTAPGSANTSNWLNVGLSTNAITENLSLGNGIEYFVSVRATDSAGEYTEFISSNGLIVDVESSQGVFIYDNSVTEDQDWTNIDYELSEAGNLKILSLAGLLPYQYAIGTSEGATDVVDWTENGLETSFNMNGLSLQSGITYHISVKATDALGNESDPFISDGVTVDFFVPTVGLPVEGELDEDIDWQSSTTSILVSWTGNDTRSREIASF